jgi:hypothetical protein
VIFNFSDADKYFMPLLKIKSKKYTQYIEITQAYVDAHHKYMLVYSISGANRASTELIKTKEKYKKTILGYYSSMNKICGYEPAMLRESADFYK